ncbi:ATP-binding protein [Thauera sp.]|uniref:ATP-binding protein n=1 Tax=Thauera sp. TaxID=1905334 RepID=UPI0026203D7A|nr:ATP-binding protein [Thauera sp.]
MPSIRRRTLLLVLGLLGVALGAISFLGYRDARHEIQELFDARLAQQARLLAGMIPGGMAPQARAALQDALDAGVLGSAAQDGSEGGGDGDEERPLGHEYEGKLGFVVYDDRGGALLQSAAAPLGALDTLLALRPAGAFAAGAPPTLADAGDRLAGYHTVKMADGDWRLFLLRDARDGQWILVGERADVRGELVGKITLRSLLPDLVGLPLLALLVWLAIGWGLRPLARIAEQLKARGPDDLSALVLRDVPQELEALVAALDRLLHQVNELLERERRFLAYAAHELRTPLAVLRIHVQNALQAPDPADREAALRQLETGIERATRVVAQLLILARLEPEASRLRMQRTDLLALARGELAELTPLALEHGQELALEADERADHHLLGDAGSLGILLQNLVSNAVRHTPADGCIRVLLDAFPATLVVRVQDSGAGVPPALRGKVFERFFRAGGGEGAGLGLSIVARIVELHGGTIALDDGPLGGLEVRVRLPRGDTHRYRHPMPGGLD